MKLSRLRPYRSLAFLSIPYILLNLWAQDVQIWHADSHSSLACTKNASVIYWRCHYSVEF
jgi:hypothetical protein